MMYKKLLTLALLAWSGLFFALSLELDIDPAAFGRNFRGTEAAPILEPGVPALNYLPVRVLIPFGHRVENLNVILAPAEVQRENLELDYVRAQQKISQPQEDQTQPDPLIWNSDEAWPREDFRFFGIQSMRGFQIAVINIYPWKYEPGTKRILASSSARIVLDTVFDENVATGSANFYSPARGSEDLYGFVINPDLAQSYQTASAYRNHSPKSRLIDLSNPKKMIVITDETSAPLFQNYMQWRDSQSISTALFYTSDIYDGYDGVDNAEKVRNFIVDVYQTWADSDSPLEYVILGGDDEIVPERGCYGKVYETVDMRMPTDLYFGNLDGDWNANGNNIWGEPEDDVDMLPEVHVGRFPAETAREFNNMFRKTEYYVTNNTFSNNISIMFGENLNNHPVTWGGDYKDDVATHIPDTYFMRTMYQRDGTYSDQGVWDTINQGANVMNHMGHANETYLMGQGNGSIERLENTEYGFLYTQGCYPAAFDQRTSGDGECIGEHLVTTEGGLFAFIGNTRYGWYMPGSIDGPSQFYDREFFIGLYETSNTTLGKALSYSRVQNLNHALSSDVMRWCYYEVVLFGDPSVELKHPDPSLPLLSLESYMFSDVEGDDDGSINPGEIIRLYPRIRNLEGWGAAHNVTVTLDELPQGVQLLDDSLQIPLIQPGETSSENDYLRLQLLPTASYGITYLKLKLESFQPDTGLSTGVRSYELSLDITMVDSNFPWDCQIQTKSSPIVYDFDGDGSPDIMYLDVQGRAYYINDSAEELWDWYAPPRQDVMRSAAMGDLVGDEALEIVYASRTGRVHAATLDGSLVFNYETGSQVLFSPVIAPIDHSGENKVIVGTLDGHLHAINPNGTAVPGFPIELGSSLYSELAAADIDGDGIMEIIAGTQHGLLHVVDGQGNPKPGFPINVSGNISGAPTILDNGRIALGTNNRFKLISPTAEILVEKPIQAAMASSPVLADLNSDGALDIIFITINGWLYAVDQNGEDLSGFPVHVGGVFNVPPLIADLDDDPQFEILVSNHINSVFIYNHDGSLHDGYPFVTSFNGCTPGTICDLNGNGKLDLVSGYSTGVLVLNLRVADSGNHPWPVYRGALNRQGSHAAAPVTPVSDPELPGLVDNLAQNYPNPFNPTTSIAFQNAKAGDVTLAIYNLKGQLVKVLHSGQLAAGNHKVVWDGKDEIGRAAASGLYFYRLQTSDSSITRRMLLLK